MLNRLADLMEANMEELAMLEVMDNGKTIGESWPYSCNPYG